MTKEFTVLSGETYSVIAETEEEALEKFYAWNDDEPCIEHSNTDCDCVVYAEAMSVVL